MHEAREDDARLLSGEGTQPDTGDSTVNALRSAQKFPSYLRLLPTAEMDSSRLLANPISLPQLSAPSPESYARYLQVQKYTSIEARTQRVVARAGKRLKEDVQTAAMFVVIVPIVGACIAESWISNNITHRRKPTSF